MSRRYRSIRMSSLLSFSVALIFIAAGALTIAVVNQKMRQQALAEAEAKMRLMLDQNMTVHTYFSQLLKPNLFAWTESFRNEDYFDPTWMSSTYAVREMEAYFAGFNTDDYYYKDAAINARSPENEADVEERAFITALKADPTLEGQTTVRTIEGEPYLVVLRPGEVLEESCLRCHGDPNNAPQDLVRWYGPDRSFHREAELGNIISAISVRVPLAIAYQEADRLSLQLSLLLLALLGAVFGVQFWLSRRLVFQPLDKIRRLALQISSDSTQLGQEVAIPVGRELGEVTTAINTMSVELDKAQQQLLQQERLAVLGQLTGGIGHELRTPLSNIKNATYLLGMLLGETPDPEVTEALSFIDRGIADADNIISSLLNFARTRAPAWQIVHIDAVLDEALMQIEAPDTVALDISHDAAAPLPELYADPDQLVKVFGNLITNAIQAMPDGGSLRIWTATAMRQAQEGLEIAISDTGVGISEESMARLFEPMFTTKKRGVGLGLALTKMLVEAHGGAIEVVSELGKGTTFTIWLPITQAEEDGG